MANWCYNHVQVFGKEENVKKVMDIFTDLKKKSEERGEGVLPDGYSANENNSCYMFGIYILSDTTLAFESKWYTPIGELQWIANTYNVVLHVSVEELGCEVFGRIVFKPHENHKELMLDSKDFESIFETEYDYEIPIYHFKGEDYESISEALDHVLRDKFGDELDKI